MNLLRRYRAKVVGRLVVTGLRWSDNGVRPEVRLDGILEDGTPELGKTYLLIEEVER